MKTFAHRNTIKWFFIVALCALVVFMVQSCAPKTGCPAIYKNGMKGYSIIQECHSPQGISIVYKDKEGKEWGLDYMTRREYDSLLNTFGLKL